MYREHPGIIDMQVRDTAPCSLNGRYQCFAATLRLCLRRWRQFEDGGKYSSAI